MDFNDAFAAIKTESVDDVPQVCLAIPKDLFLRSQNLCHDAVAKNPLCYGLLPIAALEDNWDLVDLAADILGESNARSPELIHSILESMPPIMRDCFLFFLRNPPEWLESSQKQIRLSYFRYHYKLPVEPNVSDEQAAKWVDEYFEIGYAMVPHKERHPELLHIIVRSHHEMRNLKMIPESVIKSNIDYVRTLFKSGPATLIEYIPENLRDDDMYRSSIKDIIVNNRHASKLLRLIPDAIWDANPELVLDIIDANPLNYKELPLSVREHHAGSAAEQAVSGYPMSYAHIIPESVKEGNWGLAHLAVSLDPTQYIFVPLDMRQSNDQRALDLTELALKANPHAYQNDIPESVKESNWELARLAVSLDPNLYAYVPENMKNFEMNGDERALDLAQLASKHRRCIASDFDTMQEYRQGIVQRPQKICEPNMGFENMSIGTQNGLLNRLYNTGEHAHLRGLENFQQAKALVAQAHSKKGTVTGLAAHRQGLFSKLSKDTRGHIMSFVPHTNSLAIDHALWCKSQLLLLQEHIDRFMYMFHFNPQAELLELYTPFVVELVTRFCDPRYALSVDPSDEPRADAVLDPNLAQTVANAVFQWLAIMRSADDWNTQEEVKSELIRLGFPPPANQVNALAKRYFAEPLFDASGNDIDTLLFSEYS